ncbi:TetR/AcrR family transcriptional regulator [Butyricicoccus sp.]|uniref:TetR/AcrR family transcriptional regulator n=1 Tax=Butyricicoccus sp. TaxID=2049021 RepID=UPI003F16010F
MTTKERIVDEALTLFSRQGYKGTSVKNIADAVGIKDSSIYKHFKSKREIIDAIVDQMRARMDQMSVDAGLPQETNETAAAIYGRMTVEDLQQMSRKVFLFYLTDDFISRFWRLAMIEQYQNEEIYEIYRSIFFDQSIVYQTGLFAEMIRQGIFRQADPRVLAMNFYAPIYFLLSKYNGRTENVEEALQTLDMQVAEFCRIYTVQERNSHI